MARNGSVWRADATSASCRITLPDGTSKRVQANDPFAETVRDTARSAGLSKFTVYVDGSKMNADDAPTNFAGLTEVELKKYDEGAY